ncbi:hypothetical protein L3V83_10700 [Thiotrichales bacterium 19X7-9]|nr:hypothetical protein [Thiotrichales bacterium 19X7-9]
MAQSVCWPFRNKIDSHKYYGLGLAIVHELINLSSGTIIFKNHPSLGLEINISWPRLFDF